MIGIDGLDVILLEKWGNVLPNFRRLKEDGIELKIEPTYPMDSPSIWSSIYTGLTPANHGILNIEDYNIGLLRGKTFWDIASKHGKQICTINPFLAYPAWQVNGIMVSGPPSYKEKEVSAYPESLLERYNIPHMGGVLEKYPTREELKNLYEKMKRITLDEAEFGLRILKDYDWDLGFICFITLDGIEHFFWRYFDENDPTYPGNNPYKNMIKDIYKLHDKIIGEYIKLDYDNITVLSDHGHGMRNTKLVNINEILREKRYLKPKTKASTSLSSYLVSIMKSKLTNLLYKYNLDNFALKLTRVLPSITKSIKKSTFSIDFENSLVYLSDLHGMNPAGGIEINSKVLNVDYEQLRAEIIKEVSMIRDLNTGKKIVKWVCKREDLYNGKYISTFPDIVFELEGEYGVNWDIYAPIVTECYAHKIISGGHKESAVFIIEGTLDKKIVRSNMTSVDIAPTVMDLLHIEGNFNFDGKSIFQ